MLIFFGIIIWLVLCFVVAKGAQNRNRSGFSFFLIAALLSPLIGAFILIVLGNKTHVSSSGTNPSASYTTKSSTITCPKCYHENDLNSKKCSSCNYTFKENIMEIEKPSKKMNKIRCTKCNHSYEEEFFEGRMVKAKSICPSCHNQEKEKNLIFVD